MSVRLWKRILLVLLSASAALGADVHAFTEELPPLNHQEGQQVTGFSSELLRQVCARAGLSVQIELLPWIRAELSARKDPDAILFTLTRTPEREAQYVWLGPISRRRILLVRLAERPEVNPASLEDARRFKVGATLESASMRQLRRLGFMDGVSLDSALNDAMNFKKLLGRRVDLIAILDWAAAWQARQNGVPFSSLTPVLTLDESRDYYYGLNLAVDPAKAVRLQKALEALRRSGQLDALRAQYFR